MGVYTRNEDVGRELTFWKVAFHRDPFLWEVSSKNPRSVRFKSSKFPRFMNVLAIARTAKTPQEMRMSNKTGSPRSMLFIKTSP
jgi:hypothetical protein